jgi:hypothetical protein
MAHNRSEIPHHHERRLLQRLRDAGWVKASKILATPSFIEKLVAKGWMMATFAIASPIKA